MTESFPPFFFFFFQYTDTKGYCEDITEGKFSFPVIHSIHSDPSNRQMISK